MQIKSFGIVLPDTRAMRKIIQQLESYKRVRQMPGYAFHSYGLIALACKMSAMSEGELKRECDNIFACYAEIQGDLFRDYLEPPQEDSPPESEPESNGAVTLGSGVRDAQ